jgi:hypothetical protein
MEALPNDGARFRCTFDNGTHGRCEEDAVGLVTQEDVDSLREYGWTAMRALCAEHVALAEDRG